MFAYGQVQLRHIQIGECVDVYVSRYLAFLRYARAWSLPVRGWILLKFKVILLQNTIEYGANDNTSVSRAYRFSVVYVEQVKYNYSP